jgi:glycosyltransferase involved in cell wall biosynthesis
MLNRQGRQSVGATTCIFTIASKNYLAHVRTLMASLAEHHPEVSRCLVLCDRIDGYFDPQRENYAVLTAEELGIDRFAELAFQYNCLELNTAVKPFAIKKLLADGPWTNVVYLDPDIVLYRPMHEALDLLNRQDAVLTPHLTGFLPDDGCLPDNLRILQTGTNNLGFFALRRSERTAVLLTWWKSQLRDRCVHAIEEGLFVDQKWMDLVPSCVESSCLLRHPGYNVAYWNLPHRRITRDRDGRCHVNGQPLVFFHFSGFDVRDLRAVSKHQNRLTWGDLGQAGRMLFRDYRRRLRENGYDEVRKWPYAYGRFENGTVIPDCLRSYYRRKLAVKIGSATPLFGVSGGATTLFELFQRPVAHGPLTTAALALHEYHADLQRAFPQVPGRDAVRYAEWLLEPGMGDARMAEAFLEPVRRLAAELAEQNSPAPLGRVGEKLRRLPMRWAREVLRIAGKRRGLINLVPPQLRHRIGGKLKQMAFPDPFPPPAEHRPRKEFCPDETALPSKMDVMDAMDGMDGNNKGDSPVFGAQQCGQSAEKLGQSPLGINLFGLLDQPSGVGEAARSAAACFEHLGIPMRSVAFDESHLFFSQRLPAASQPDPRLPINYCHVNADCAAALFHLFGGETFADRFNIGFWAWELDRFPEKWDSAFDLYDEIWVPSAFVQQSISARSRIPVVCIPHPIRVGRCPQNVRQAWGIPEGRPAVLCMFDAASFSERKNPVGALRAVKEACRGRHDPLLVVKIGRPERQEGLCEQLRAEAEPLDCLIIDRWLGREEVWELIAACDLLVSLHRSEGFGLILAEAMALGKPVVATGYSGNMDFMNSANSRLVGYELVELERDIGPYPAGARWANPDIGQAAQMIRQLLDDPQQGRILGQKAAQDIARHLSVDAVSRRIFHRLTRLGFHFAPPEESRPVQKAA